MTKAIFTAFLGMFFMGCALFSSKLTLENSSWALISISNESINIQKTPVIRFLDKKAAGFNGVNNFNANYEVSNGKIIFSDMISTRMAALSPELSKLETDFTNTLLNVVSFESNGDILTIRGADNTLIFKRAK
ncbi:MAG: META domain-containing protein [Campylobacteraceae bacterium]|jgi:heat shock protein HslJ|nr:META domain-containing protein [Campylobacteraceae bacterium]